MDFVTSKPGSDPIVVEGHFAAPPSKLFEAWTNPDIVMQWFGLSPNSIHSVSIDLRQGGAWQFLKTKDEKKSIGFEGRYLDIQPNKKLVFSWSLVTVLSDGTRDATPSSRVEVEFVASGEGTDLKLVHSSIHSEETSLGFGRGWEIALSSLAGIAVHKFVIKTEHSSHSNLKTQP